MLTETNHKTKAEPPISILPEENKNDYVVPVFMLQKPLSLEQAVALADSYSEPRIVERGVIIGFLEEEVDVETAVSIFSAQTIIRIMKDELRREKEAPKPERKRRWSPKTTWDRVEKTVNKIFHREIGEEELFKAILSLVREFSRIYREPYIYRGRGPKLRYDPVIVTALLILKFALGIGNETLIRKAKRLGIDARISPKARDSVPGETHLRNLSGREDLLDWLDEFTSWLALEKAAVYLRFFERREFVFDGTNMATREFEEAIMGGNRVLRRETIEVKFLFNINLDMHVYVEATRSHSVEKALSKLSRGDVLMADSEFFTRENCEKILAKGLKPGLKPSKNAKRGPAIKLCRQLFDSRQYKKRKNGERGAKIYSETVMLYRDPDRRRGAIKLMAAAHNIKRLIKLQIKYNVVMRLVTLLT